MLLLKRERHGHAQRGPALGMWNGLGLWSCGLYLYDLLLRYLVNLCKKGPFAFYKDLFQSKCIQFQSKAIAFVCIDSNF